MMHSILSRFATLIVAGLLLCTPHVSYALSIDWSWINPGPQGEQLNSIAFDSANSVYVAVGVRGHILSSSDGINWTVRYYSDVNDVLEDVIWSGSQFVAVGQNGQIMTSPDGITWTHRLSGIDGWLMSVAGNGSLYVAAGNPGECVLSLNGIDWQRYPGPGVLIYDILWDGSQFVAVGTGIWTSTNGVNWTQRQTSFSLNSIEWNGSLYVAVGTLGEVYTSTDAVIWTLQNVNSFDSFNAVQWDGQRFLAAGGYTLLSSPDGIQWTASSPPSYQTAQGLLWDGAMFVSVGNGGSINTSSNATSWLHHQSSLTSDYMNGYAWNGTTHVAVGGATGFWPSETILSSTDGISWVKQTSPTTRMLNDVVWGHGQFVAVSQGSSPVSLTSPDGITWSWHATAPVTGDLKSVTWSPQLNLYVAVGGTVAVWPWESDILTSPDGITWTQQVSPVAEVLDSVFWNGSQFIAGGITGAIITSPDGITWTPQASGTSSIIDAFASNGTLTVAAASFGVILTTTDGVTWTPVNSGIADSLVDIVWTGQMFIAIGLNGSVISSPDGINWREGKSLPIGMPNAIGMDGSRLYVTGGSGALLSGVESPVNLPEVFISLNASLFSPGDTLTLSANTYPGTPPLSADVWVVLNTPGATKYYLRLNGSISPQPLPVISSWNVGQFTGDLMSHVFDGTEPAGKYLFEAALTEPGTMNVLGPVSKQGFTVQ